MSKAPLFSVIMLHYNQERFLYGAIDSVLNQSYASIEFIFADDCSSSLNVEKLANYIETSKRENIENVVLQINETNMGTVKNINSAVKRCKGEYILFFAADDCLYDEDTIRNFVEVFQGLPDDRLVVTGQCDMFDENLKEFQYKFVDEDMANRLNQSTAQEQYFRMAYGCIYAMGATAVRREIFERFGYFDERYKLIEDWSYFLHVTREGTKITYCDFDALRHRDGGVSHHNRVYLPPHVLVFKNDMLLIQEYEIIPYLTMFPIQDQQDLLAKYEQARVDYAFERERIDFARMFVSDSRKRRIEIVRQTSNLHFQRFLSYAIRFIQRGLRESVRYLPASFVSWVSFEVLSVLLLHFDAGLSQIDTANVLVYRVLDLGLPIVLIANGIAIVFFAILNILNYCRRSLKKYLSGRI